MRSRSALTAAFLTGAATALAGRAIRRRSLRWGATEAESRQSLPGDEMMARAHLQSDRAVTIGARAQDVWPWIAQLGQGRGGFYSYDALENLVGCDIHSADTVVAQWQRVEVGDQVRLAPELSLTVARVDPGRSLVLRGGVPLGSRPAPYDFSWAFVLVAASPGSTRLVVRERYAYQEWWAPLIVEPAEIVSFLMSTRMLHGIKQRAESAAPLTPTFAAVAQVEPGANLHSRPRGFS